MKRMVWVALVLLAAPAAAQVSVADAVADAGRPAAEVALDAGRKPAEMLAFAGLNPGERVLDVMAGRGYYSRIAVDVVGPGGAVFAMEPAGYLKNEKHSAGWKALVATRPQLSLVPGPATDTLLPADLDLTIFHLTYHDLYWESAEYEFPRQDPAVFLAKLFAATRPGGRVLVVDHVGPAGIDPRVEAERTHRIDPAIVKRDFEAAGFRLAKQSGTLGNPADDGSKPAFDPAVRGKTDRVAWLFERPKG